MSKNLEIESKTLLDKETYEKMRAAFTAKSDFIQKNYYFLKFTKISLKKARFFFKLLSFVL